MDVFEYWQEREEIRAKGLVAAMDAVGNSNDYMLATREATTKHREERDRLWIARNQDGAIWPSPNLPGAVYYDTQAEELRIRREGGSWISLNFG